MKNFLRLACMASFISAGCSFGLMLLAMLAGMVAQHLFTLSRADEYVYAFLMLGGLLIFGPLGVLLAVVGLLLLAIMLVIKFLDRKQPGEDVT